MNQLSSGDEFHFVNVEHPNVSTTELVVPMELSERIEPVTPDQSTEESETTQFLVTTKPVPADSFNEYNKNFSSLDFDYDYDNNISFIDFDFSPDYEYSDEILSQSNLNSTDLNFTTLGFSLEIFIRSLVVTMLTILFLLLILALVTNTIKLCKMCKPTTSV